MFLEEHFLGDVVPSEPVYDADVVPPSVDDVVYHADVVPPSVDDVVYHADVLPPVDDVWNADIDVSMLSLTIEDDHSPVVTEVSPPSTPEIHIKNNMPPTLVCYDHSGEYCLSRIIQPLGRPNIKKHQALIKECINRVYKKVKTTPGTDVQKITRGVFGNTHTGYLTHMVVCEVLKQCDLTASRVISEHIPKIVNGKNTTFLVYCKLNARKLPNKNISNKPHMILIKQGIAYCVHLMMDNHRNKRVPAWKFVDFDDDLDFTQDSFIEKIIAVYHIV